MKVFVGYLIMVGGVWALCYASYLQTSPKDDWMFFPFLATFFLVEGFGAHLSKVLDYF